MRILAFDIWGDFGHFKKFYTTSSPLTFSIPTPTAIYGIIAAILGLDKKEYLKIINGRTTTVGIQILKPVKKTRITVNHIDTKLSSSFHLIKSRTQIRTEFLKEPKYRLYVHIKDDQRFQELIQRVKKKESVYTLSLGLAYLLANFAYVGDFDAEQIDSVDRVESVILADNAHSLEIEEGKKYFKEKLPIDMNEKREVRLYKDIIMELNGKPLVGEFTNCWRIQNMVISLIDANTNERNK